MQNITNLKDEVINLKDIMIKISKMKTSFLKPK